MNWQQKPLVAGHDIGLPCFAHDLFEWQTCFFFFVLWCSFAIGLDWSVSFGGLDGRVVLAAGAVLFAASGALVLWHKRLHSVAYDEALCPRDRWLEDPALWEANVGQMDEDRYLLVNEA